MGTFARLDVVARGEIVRLRKADSTRYAIREVVKRKDRKFPPLRAVDDVLLRKKTTPSWRGGDSRAGGATCRTFYDRGMGVDQAGKAPPLPPQMQQRSKSHGFAGAVRAR